MWAQVLADGKGKFRISIFKGGLPGAGWDGKSLQKSTATTKDGKTTVEWGGWTGSIGDERMIGKNPDGAPFDFKRVVRKSPNEGMPPPKGALILFDGSGAGEWNGGKIVEDKLLGPGPTTKKTFRDFTLHVEFCLPFKPTVRGQNRGNSGVYLQQRYEIQILDSFGLEPKNNDCGAIYERVAPSVNMCFPPLSWQTYDIDFTAARFDKDGKKTAKALVTVNHNGVVIHDKTPIDGSTGFGQKEQDTPGPINLQNHGNPVYFRNVWLVEK